MVGNQRGKTIGTFMAFSTIGALFGPVISGGIVDTIGWKSSFLFTAILGAVSILLFLVVPKVKVEQRQNLDYIGLSLVIIVLLGLLDRKSTRLNSSHVAISYAVFCLKKKNIVYIIL